MRNYDEESLLFPADTDWKTFSGYGGFELIHKGSYADTYRAKKEGKYFLLKVPHKGDSRCLSIVKREYEISVALAHPNIVSVVTFEPIPQLGPCIVMEYIDGCPLGVYLAAKPSAKERKKVIGQLLLAIGYLHEKSIVHNDIKPDNIIITTNGHNLKLIDFGLSDDDAHYLAKTIGCTPDYASPELLGGGVIDARSDIYSLGLILKETLPGRYPLIVRKCLQNDSNHRYRSVSDLGNAIKCRKTFGLVAVAAALLAVGITIAMTSGSNRNVNDDKLLIKRYDNAIDSLTAVYLEKIAQGSTAVEIYGSWQLEFLAVSDSCQNNLKEESSLAVFEAHRAQMLRKSSKALYDASPWQ